MVSNGNELWCNTLQGTQEDYLELFIQFGYILLFAVAYPSACFWAWINNVAELKVDAFKLINIYRRPNPARVANIGAWEPAFRMMSSIAVVTNCALLYMMSRSARNDSAEFSQWTDAVACVSLEHLLLLLQYILNVLIPAVPKEVYIITATRKAKQS